MVEAKISWRKIAAFSRYYRPYQDVVLACEQALGPVLYVPLLNVVDDIDT